MKKSVRELYSQRHIRRVKRFEREFLRPVFNAIQEQMSSFIKVMKTDGIDTAKRRMDETIINTELTPVIRDIYLTVGSYFAKKTMGEINRSAREEKAFGVNEEMLQAILNYFSQFLLNKAVIPITHTTKEQILATLELAEKEGWSEERIALELESDELTLWRARMIVRTETAKAMFEGQRLGREKVDWESDKIWIAANDHRTRHSHRQVDDEERPEATKFAVPRYKKIGNVSVQVGVDMMDGPGDLNASAANLINCRCTLAHRAMRDENGDLIVKQTKIRIL